MSDPLELGFQAVIHRLPSPGMQGLGLRPERAASAPVKAFL